MQLGLIVLPQNEDQMNKVLAALSKLGVSTAAAPVSTGKTTSKAASAPADEPEDAAEENLKVPTGPELQAILTQVRDDLGQEALTEILTAFGASKLKELDKSDWPAAFAAAQQALGDGDDDDLLDDDGEDDDDLLDDGDDEEGPDAEEVKTACQNYAKKHGKDKTNAILKKNGLNTVRGLASAPQAVLTAVYKAVGGK